MTQEKLNEILDTLDWERDNLHFIESRPRDEWTERNAKRKRITIQALEMASEALKKQMPKKSTYGHLYGEMGCEFCGNMVSGWDELPNYCPHCGQAIDWSEE